MNNRMQDDFTAAMIEDCAEAATADRRSAMAAAPPGIPCMSEFWFDQLIGIDPARMSAAQRAEGRRHLQTVVERCRANGNADHVARAEFLREWCTNPEFRRTATDVVLALAARGENR